MTTMQCRAAFLAIVAAIALASGFLLAPMMSRAQSGTPAAQPAQSLIAQGEQIYTTVCIACHRPGGEGVKGIYPALAGDALVKLNDPKVVISTVLNGRGGMPRFDDSFSDDQIAAIVSYIRGSWGNNASSVTAEQVAAIRASFAATPVAASPMASPAQNRGVQSGSSEATPTP